MTTAREKYEIEVTLHDGRVVGSWSQEWRIECEAKHLLAMPLRRRQEELDARVRIRGSRSVDKLKQVMISIHKHRRQNHEAAPVPAVQQRLQSGQDMPLPFL